MGMTAADFISIKDLTLSSFHLESDLWSRSPSNQPLIINLSINSKVNQEAILDDLTATSLNYGFISKQLIAAVDSLSAPLSLELLADHLARIILFNCHAPNVLLRLARPRAILSAQSIEVHIYRDKSDYIPSPPSSDVDYFLSPTSTNHLNDKLVLNALRRSVIIGLNPQEREDEQEVIVDIEFGAAAPNQDDMKAFKRGIVRAEWKDWRRVVKDLESHLSSSKPLTIEAITTSLSKIVLTPPLPSPHPHSTKPTWDVAQTTVRLSKPSALVFAKYPSVQITRSRSDFFSAPFTRSFVTSSTPREDKRIAVLGIGSNLGNRVVNLTNALKELDASGSTKVIDTSFLYESEAMYVEDQAKFLNAVVKIETSLNPIELLKTLKSIEKLVGREKTFRNGPRVIDLDILFYDDLVLDTRLASPDKELWLKIPHEKIQEREFVLRPLIDIASNFHHPVLHHTSKTLLSTLLTTTPSTLHQVLPLSQTHLHPLKTKTILMSILNLTPDSFSDGGDNFSMDSALASALEHVESGIEIIDVGGMSTRPGADDVSEEEELSRVIPIIEAIRNSASTTLSNIPISIDTFRPSVAKASIEAGATIINDVLGGTEPGMLKLMAELDVPVVLMHSRGNPKTMSELTTYEDGDVVTGVRKELEERVKEALCAGVKRWNIIIDPGLGFAKKGSQNTKLLQQLPAVLGKIPTTTSDSGVSLGAFPSLVGLSRKKFLGTLIEKSEAKERDWATAAAVTASILGGADIIRVHNVKMGVDVVRVSDAIWNAVD